MASDLLREAANCLDDIGAEGGVARQIASELRQLASRHRPEHGESSYWNDQFVYALARKAGLPKFMWDTANSRAALGRFANLSAEAIKPSSHATGGSSS